MSLHYGYLSISHNRTQSNRYEMQKINRELKKIKMITQKNNLLR